MNFKLEAYDVRYACWKGCTLFQGDFERCQTPEEAQTLLDRVAAVHGTATFRVRYDSVLTPGDPLRLNAADHPKAILNKSYELQFWSSERNSWYPSGLISVDLSQCQSDEQANVILGEVRQMVPEMKYRIEVTTGTHKYIIE